MPFQDQDGKVALPKLNPDGSVPVADVGDLTLTDFAQLIYRELREQRRLFCELNGLMFEEDL